MGFLGNLTQRQIAANSVLRDWLKGQLTAREWGVLSFDEVLTTYMFTESGGTLAQHIKAKGLLPGARRRARA